MKIGTYILDVPAQTGTELVCQFTSNVSYDVMTSENGNRPISLMRKRVRPNWIGIYADT